MFKRLTPNSLFALSVAVSTFFLLGYKPGDTGLYDLHRLSELFLLISGIVLLLSFRKKSVRFISFCKQLDKRLLFGLAFIFLLGVISSLFSPVPRAGIIETFHIGLLLILIFFIASEVQRYDTQSLQKSLLVFLVSGVGIYVVTFWHGYLNGLFYPEVPLWPDRPDFNIKINGEYVLPNGYLGFANVRHFNDVQSWTLPLLALAWLKIPAKLYTYRGIVAAIGTMWYMLLFASDGRGTSLSMILTSGIVWLLFKKKSYPWLKVNAWMASAGFMAWLLFFKIFQTGKRTFASRYQSDSRLEAWADTLEHIISAPILGIGPMHYSWIEYDPITAHAHNFYLQIAAEWGIPVFIIAGSIVLYSLVQWINFSQQKVKESQLRANEYISFTAVLFVTGGSALVGSTFHTPISQLFMILIIGLMIGWFIKENHLPETANLYKKKTNITAARILIFIIFIGFIFSLYPDLKTLTKRSEVYLETLPEDEKQKLSPRFWEQGKIGLEEKDIKTEVQN